MGTRQRGKKGGKIPAPRAKLEGAVEVVVNAIEIKTHSQVAQLKAK